MVADHEVACLGPVALGEVMAVALVVASLPEAGPEAAVHAALDPQSLLCYQMAAKS